MVWLVVDSNFQIFSAPGKKRNGQGKCPNDVVDEDVRGFRDGRNGGDFGKERSGTYGKSEAFAAEPRRNVEERGGAQ